MTLLESATTPEATTNDNSKSRSSNPFERLRPVPRSEEDEIRKGIFGQALRLLFSASDADKIRWRIAIEEAVAARQCTTRQNQKKRQEQLKRGVVETDDDIQQPDMIAVMKRSRKEDGTNDNETDKGKGEEYGEKPLPFQQQDADEGETGFKGLSRSNASGERLTTDDTGSPSPSDVEFIAAYLRTLLDKVVGLSLLELHVDALRVLCVMLNIPLPNNKSKMAHYSTLASFYYIHCEKLGKRVPRTCYLGGDEEDLDDNRHMKKKTRCSGSTAHVSATGGKTKMKVVSSTEEKKKTETAAAEVAKKPVKKSKDSYRSILGTVDDNAFLQTSAPGMQQSKPVANGAAATGAGGSVSGGGNLMSVDSELEVQHNGRLFTDRHQQERFSSLSHPPHNHNVVGENSCDEEDEWSMAHLEKKVASVVHLYDPVTSTVVVKKLAQMGYRSSSALQTVEAILRSFHQRQFVFYDNGIAYLL